MGRTKTDVVKFKRQKPANTPEGRENQMIELAERRAEQELLDGTASSQLICHYLQLATVKKRLENEKLQREVELLQAKTKLIESEKNSEELYLKAIKAIGIYQGKEVPDDDEDIF